MVGPRSGPSEVRIRLTASGVNPGDVKNRDDTFGLGMMYPRVIPRQTTHLWEVASQPPGASSPRLCPIPDSHELEQVVIEFQKLVECGTFHLRNIFRFG